ncbi:MAG: hypothetical protein ABIO33_05985 [Leifsonia sp.]
MDGDLLALFTGIADAERLTMLREQLWLLTGVRDEVQVHRQILQVAVTGTPGYQWRSVAQRGYAEQLAELSATLGRAERDLDAACDAVREGLARHVTRGG